MRSWILRGPEAILLDRADAAAAGGAAAEEDEDALLDFAGARGDPENAPRSMEESKKDRSTRMKLIARNAKTERRAERAEDRFSRHLQTTSTNPTPHRDPHSPNQIDQHQLENNILGRGPRNSAGGSSVLSARRYVSPRRVSISATRPGMQLRRNV